MEIKDIVEQQKLKKALERSKKKQDDFTRKEFLKDCYKFWKEYKKVEHPYTWWLGWFSLDYILFGRWENFRKVRFNLPEDYVENSWFSTKWECKWVLGVGYKFRRKADPNGTFYWYRY